MQPMKIKEERESREIRVLTGETDRDRLLARYQAGAVRKPLEFSEPELIRIAADLTAKEKEFARTEAWSRDCHDAQEDRRAVLRKIAPSLPPRWYAHTYPSRSRSFLIDPAVLFLVTLYTLFLCALLWGVAMASPGKAIAAATVGAMLLTSLKFRHDVMIANQRAEREAKEAEARQEGSAATRRRI